MYKVHSVQALTAHLADKTSATWHHLHLQTRDLYSDGLTQLKDAIRAGTAYTRSHRLAYYASTFIPTTSISQELSIGFYDTLDAQVSVASILPASGLAPFV